LDLLVGESLTIMHHFIQKAPHSTEFEKQRDIVFSAPPPYYNHPVVMDLDGDGSKEMLVGGQDRKILLYRQDAAVKDSFILISGSWSGITDAECGAPAIADIDGDGLLDLFVGTKAGLVHHYRQPSANALDNWELRSSNVINTWDFGLNSSSLVCDLDGDGRLDILRTEVLVEVGNAPRPIQHFRQQSIGSLQVEYLGTFSGLLAGIYDCMAITDFDADGRLDFFITRLNRGMEQYRQKAGDRFVFELVTENFLPGVSWVFPPTPVFTDLDNNGKRDLLLAMTFSGQQIDRYEEGSAGSGNFGLVQEGWMTKLGYYAFPHIIDYDNDGLLDMLLGKEDGSIRHLEQNGTASTEFEIAGTEFDQIQVGNLARPMVFDVNNDGRLDVIVGDGAGGLSLFLDMGPNAVASPPTAANGMRILDASPQPFSDFTTLRVELPACASVTLRVFDLLGREVARPLETAFREAGAHAFHLNLQHLAAGVYQAVVSTPDASMVAFVVKR
jgi:hypothetical protein